MNKKLFQTDRQTHEDMKNDWTWEMTPKTEISKLQDHILEPHGDSNTSKEKKTTEMSNLLKILIRRSHSYISTILRLLLKRSKFYEERKKS